MKRGLTRMPKVSVLVPVYNVERYLSRCLDSLLAQTLRDIEIICIDDGSTDGSPDILRRYAQRDARVKVITKANSGYGASMNCGLDAARGNYVAIVESDDYASRFMLGVLYSQAVKGSCDLVKSTFFEHCGWRNRWVKNFRGHAFGEVFDPADRPQIICTIPSIWTGLYRRETLLCEGIRFRETPGAAFQDTAFTLKAWFAAKTCSLVRWPLLFYRVDNPGSSVKTSDKALVVCDEVADAERFLRERPERCAKFASWFSLDKFGKYRWNYERVAPELRLQFIERIREEFVSAQELGELQPALFSEADWGIVQQLVSGDAESFIAKFPERF